MANSEFADRDASTQSESSANSERKKIDIDARTFALAARVLKLARSLPKDMAGLAVARQLSRSGTSVGANVEEAQGSHSRADFIHAMNIARKEARETNYWLRLIVAAELLPKRRLAALTKESEEIVRILTTIVKNAKRPR